MVEEALEVTPEPEATPVLEDPPTLQEALTALRDAEAEVEAHKASITLLRGALGSISDDNFEQREEVLKVVRLGTRIAAGTFDEGVTSLRVLVQDQVSEQTVQTFLKATEPSLLKLFGDDETKLEKVLGNVKTLDRRSFKTPQRPKGGPNQGCMKLNRL